MHSNGFLESRILSFLLKGFKRWEKYFKCTHSIGRYIKIVCQMKINRWLQANKLKWIIKEKVLHYLFWWKVFSSLEGYFSQHLSIDFHAKIFWGKVFSKVDKMDSGIFELALILMGERWKSEWHCNQLLKFWKVYQLIQNS